jgi:Ca2+-binding RTX toxin-like protein
VLTIDATAATGNAIAITGGSANDVLTGTALADIITGGAGNDAIVGLAGNDTINGGDGTDTITGGGGVDTMTGGAGADTFAFAALDVFGADGAAVADVIADFTVGTDKLQFTAFADVVSPQQAAVQAAVTALAAASTDAQIATAMAAANTTDLAVSFAVFGGNTYAYAETTGATATHVANANIFVKLTGVTTAPTFVVDVVA